MSGDKIVLIVFWLSDIMRTKDHLVMGSIQLGHLATCAGPWLHSSHCYIITCVISSHNHTIICAPSNHHYIIGCGFSNHHYISIWVLSSHNYIITCAHSTYLWSLPSFWSQLHTCIALWRDIAQKSHIYVNTWQKASIAGAAKISFSRIKFYHDDTHKHRLVKGKQYKT